MTSPKKTPPLVAYKGFDQNMQCRGFQYKEGETYEQVDPAVLCKTGFHAVTMPLDVLRYYPANKSVFHLVELEDVADGKESDSKVAGRKIKIGARIELPALIKAQVDFVFSNSKKVAGASSAKANAAVAAEVESGAATASGRYGAATASGYSGAATASGGYGAATASGYYGRARGAIGNALFLTERDSAWKIINVAAVIVDGTTIKADTFYRLVAGVVTEVK